MRVLLDFKCPESFCLSSQPTPKPGLNLCLSPLSATVATGPFPILSGNKTQVLEALQVKTGE